MIPPKIMEIAKSRDPITHPPKPHKKVLLYIQGSKTPIVAFCVKELLGTYGGDYHLVWYENIQCATATCKGCKTDKICMLDAIEDHLISWQELPKREK